MITPPNRVVPASKSVDELIVQLEQIRKEKAELEKREQVTVSQLQSQLKNQTDRLAKLGIVPPLPIPQDNPKSIEVPIPIPDIDVRPGIPDKK